MKLISHAALGAALVLCGASLVTTPAVAQKKSAQRSLSLSKPERETLVALQTAVQKKDTAAATTALAAAQAAAKGADAKYSVAALQLQLGGLLSNKQMQSQAIDALIASGAAPADALPELLKNQAGLAFEANNFAKAENALNQLTQMNPNDPDALATLAELRARQKRFPEAVTMLDRSIGIRKAAGTTIPENWYKRVLALAYQGRLVPQSIKASRDLITAYPNPTNWRDSLLIYIDLAQPDRTTTLDTRRLMRAAKALAGERDYAELANTLDRSGYPGEVKALLDEGVAAKMFEPTKAPFAQLRTAANSKIAEDKSTLPGLEKKATASATGAAALDLGDVYYGYGDFAKAISFYRMALQKGGVDTSLANMRLGMALALSGQKAEAQAAFRNVSGARAELANFWMLWLSQRA
ncbi:tetratricopeptide repeat protein [Sphingomonas sp.]|uniref:tetratricopeptide repeat protein n=1 Tax=Sphingomonas sp. TaxID=28214 RepID=UPI002FC99636